MKKIAGVVYLFFLCLGIQTSFSSLVIENATNKEYFFSILGSFLILVYFIPFVYAMKLLIEKVVGDWKVFLGGLVSGFYIAAPICIIVNEVLDAVCSFILSSSFYETWGDAFIGPTSEETVKATVCLLFMFVIGKHKIQDYLVSGIGVGLGFQLFEDITFIFPKEITTEAVNNIVPSAFDRISTSLSSHWVYTAIVVLGIYFLTKTRYKIRGIGCILGAFFLHFLWNSPLPIYAPILSTITLVVFIMVLREVIRSVEGKKAESPIEI